MTRCEYRIIDEDGLIFETMTIELRGDGWHMSMGETYRASGYRTMDEALMHFHRHRPTLKILPKSRYATKMEACIDDDGTYGEAEYARYFKTMDAICSRNPGRMNANGMEMLRKKVSTIQNVKLMLSAQRAYDELAAEVGDAV